MEKKLKIVVVDDEIHNTNGIKAYLRHDFEIVPFNNVRLAISYLQSETADIIISDKRMPHRDGVEFFKDCKIIAPSAIRILISAYVGEPELFEALEDGTVFRFIHKPFSSEWASFDRAIQEALKLIKDRKGLSNT